MNVQAEISLYPLRALDIGEAIRGFNQRLQRSGIEVRPSDMSTVLSGESSVVFTAVSDAFTAASEEGDVVMIMKASNACPGGGPDSADAP